MKRLFICMLLLAACGPARPPATQSEAPRYFSAAELARLDLRPDSLREQLIDRVLDVPGKVVVLSRSQANVSALLPGVVRRLHAHEGERVAAGGPLVTIESLELVQLQRDYLEAQAEARYLTAERERQNALMAARVGAEAERQQVVARHQAAVARHKALTEQLKLVGLDPGDYADAESATLVRQYVLRAPLSGYVFKLPATLGMTVSVGQELVHVINLNDLHADLHLSEQDVQGVREGMPVELRFTSGRVPVTRGRIEYVSRALEATERTVVAHVHIEPPAGYYVLPEMSVRARLRLPGAERRPTLAAAGVVLDDSLATVYRLESTAEGTRALPLAVRVVGRAGDRLAIEFTTPGEPVVGGRYATQHALLLKAELSRGGGE